MPRINLTKPQLETIQYLLEQAAPGATPEQAAELESIDSRIYAALFPDLAKERPTKAAGTPNVA